MDPKVYVEEQEQFEMRYRDAEKWVRRYPASREEVRDALADIDAERLDLVMRAIDTDDDMMLGQLISEHVTEWRIRERLEEIR